jgi:DNA-binding NarL/FixJ family response regulator
MKPIRVLIVDDHAVVRKGIQLLVSTESAIQIVGEAKDGRDACHQAKLLQPDLILMDLVMPHEDGIEAIAEIKRDTPNLKIIVLTTFGDDARINAALQAGADGYLLKDADGEALLQAIQAAQRGDMPLHPHVARHLFRGAGRQTGSNDMDHLTEREKEILQLVSKGLSNRDIAKNLTLSEGTVKVHVSNILNKLGVSSRTEAAIWAIQMGLVSVDQET